MLINLFIGTAVITSCVFLPPNLIGTKNQDGLLLSQSSNTSRFPFSGLKFNTIKVTQKDIDMAIMKCIEMDQNFSHEHFFSSDIEMTPASKHVLQSICDSSITIGND